MMKLGMKIRGKEGVSEIVGTVLLLAIAVIIFSSLIVYVFSYSSPSASPPDVHMVGYMGKSYTAIVENRGGDSISLNDLKVVIWKGEEESETFEGQALKSIFHDTNDNSKWDVGDYISINCAGIFGNVTHWQISIAVIDKPSNSIIMSGILQQGILHTSPPVAIFTYNPWDPKTLEILDFNASASYDPDGGAITSYSWDFGDGSTGSGMRIVHQYAHSGVYTVKLTVTDDEGQTSFTTTATGVPAQVNVTDNQIPVAYFTNTSEGNGWIYFDASQSYDPDGSITRYIWNFGDGSDSVESSNPTIKHQYQYSGQYEVTLIVVDDEVNNPGTNSTSSIALYGEKLTVPNIPPIPSFFYTPANPSTSTYVFFNATDSYDEDGNIVNYSWDFNEDGIADAYGVAPDGYLFSASGYYNITLTVTDNSNDSNSTTKMIYIRSPSGFRTFLLVDNTPHDRGFDGISNIIASLNIGDYDWGKAIDQDNFYTFHNSTGWHNNSVEINSTILDKYDIVIWSTGDFPGDGSSDPYGANSWSTPMTEGADDTSNHVAELAAHLQHNGTLLLCGAYAVRDLQEYGGNGVSQSEVDLGKVLGLYYRDYTVNPNDNWNNAPDGYDDNNGGINESLHSGETGYFTNGGTFKYGPIYANGTISGVAGTSSDGAQGVADIVVNSQMPLYSLVKQNDPLFNYSLVATGEGTPFSDNFEDGNLNGWTISYYAGNYPWRVSDFYSYSPPAGGDSVYHPDPFYGWYSNPTGPYSTGYYAFGYSGDWLISPQITVPSGGRLEFYAGSYWRWSQASFNVKLSTTGTTLSDFTVLLGTESNVPRIREHGWTRYTYDLSAYAGQQVYVAIQAITGDLFIDNFKVTTGGIPSGYYAIDAARGANRSIVLGFDLNSNAIDNLSRERYLINAINWLAEGAGYVTTVYVDNDRPIEWYDDTHVHTIQEGINRVSIGGTVYVYNGTGGYAPALVNKSVTLIGIGNPVISSSGDGEYALKVTVDWSYISNFTIQNSGNLQNGIYLDGSACTTIINCTISDAQKGIYLRNSPHSTIQNNILQGNDYGIYLEQSLGNDIRENNISSGGYGIYLQSAHSNKIQHNNIFSNTYNGINIISSENNILWNNNIYSNSGDGIYLYSSTNENTILENTLHNNRKGIYLQLSNRNVISSNEIFDNTNDGISAVDYSDDNIIQTNFVKTNNGNGINIQNSSSIELSSNNVYLNGLNAINIYYSSSNIIQFNTINHSSNEGIHIVSSNGNTIAFNPVFNNSYGIHIVSSSGNILQNNTIYNNTQTGIYLEQSLSSGSGNNEIVNNSIYFNNGKGISLSSSNKNNIENNTIYNNTQEGIFLSSFSNSNTVRNNTIYNNSYGIHLDRGNYNDITNNIIYSSIFDAIYLNLYSSENIITNNTLHHNVNGVKLGLSSVNTISNNTVWNNNGYGIYIYESDDNDIQYNNISSNILAGVGLNLSDKNTISQNVIFNSGYGIYLISSGGTGNNILNNTIYSNINHGIYLENSKSTTSGNNEITENEIYSNGGDGIYLLSSNTNSVGHNEIYGNGNGIHTNLSDDNTIDSNNIHSNNIDGLHLISSNGNRINSNNISFNTNGMYLYKSSEGDQYKIGGNRIWNNTVGVFLNTSDSNYFGYNLVNEIYNNTYGIYITASSNNHVSHNIICNNSYGVYITLSSTSNEVRENNITLNNYCIYIATGDCSSNVISSNNFVNNTLHNNSQAWDMGNNSWYKSTEGNYWSDYNGTDGDSNGRGDTPYTIPPSLNRDQYPLMAEVKWW